MSQKRIFQITFSISFGGSNIKTITKTFKSDNEYDNFVAFHRNHRFGKIIGETERINIILEGGRPFRVNDFLTIENFKEQDHFEYFSKWGRDEKYQLFTGETSLGKVKGYICLKDDNIYKLSKLYENEIIRTDT